MMKSEEFQINDDFNAYLKKKKAILYEEKIRDKIKIYLDVNYWLTLRDIHRVSSNKEFLNKIFELHNTGKYIFPISDVTYLEVLKQSDKNTRIQTIQLIDSLSEGITSISLYERITLEVMTYFGKALPIKLYKNEELVWTKLPFILGTFIPPYKFNSIEDTKYINERFIDHLWDMKFIEIDKCIGNDIFHHFDNTEYLNAMKIEHISEHKSFKKLYLAELSGGLEAHRDIIEKAMKDLFYYCTNDEKGYLESFKTKSNIIYAIYNLIRLGKVKEEFPAIDIPSGLFAAVRWDKNKPHDKNDTMDFIHSSFALPYCNYFFTEKPLNSMIINGNLSYDKKYDCIVLSKRKDVENMVMSLE